MTTPTAALKLARDALVDLLAAIANAADVNDDCKPIAWAGYVGGNGDRQAGDKLDAAIFQAVAAINALPPSVPSGEPAGIAALVARIDALQASKRRLIDELFKTQQQRDDLRRALEIIALGDAQNPQAQAAEELIALGYWRDIPEARMPVATPAVGAA